jgi:CRISPR-associated endonuclease/helicase Cas3
MLARGRDTINPFDDLSEEAGSLTRDGEMSLGLIPFSSSPCDMTLLDGTVVSELEEWQKWETFSMNAVPVPAFWKNDLEYFEEGYMKIILVEEGTGIWKTNTDYYSYCYTKERGLERTKT